MRVPTVTIFLAACIAAPPAAYAQDPGGGGIFDSRRLHVPLGGAAVLALPGELAILYQHVDSIEVEPVDDRGASIPADDSTLVHLRLSPSVTLVDPGDRLFNVWRLHGELDLVHDWVDVGPGRDLLAADDRARSDTGLVGQRLSQLYFAASGQHLALQLGLVRSRWGLGLLSNPGESTTIHTSESPFGYGLQGDHVVRLGVSAFPLGEGLAAPPLTASLAFDAVVDDDTARWQDGDRAYQVIAALRGQTGALQLGLYVAHRFQTHAEGGDTEVTVVDVTGRVQLADEEDLSVFVEGELATIRGRTSLTRSVLSDASFDVAQLGGLLRLAVAPGRFLWVLEVGAASADDNPFDDEQRAFTMDRDHRVGLLLFRELLMTHNAITVANVADEDYRGRPPRGSDRIATGGAVRGAFYVNPRLSLRLSDGLVLYTGFLYAVSDGEYVDAFWSGLDGGAPHGPRNAVRSNELGWEWDFGLWWRAYVEPIQLHLRLEGGWLKPGAAFDDEDGRAARYITGLFMRGGIQW